MWLHERAWRRLLCGRRYDRGTRQLGDGPGGTAIGDKSVGRDVEAVGAHDWNRTSVKACAVLDLVGKCPTAAHEKIDDVIAHAVIERMSVNVGAFALFRQWIVDDFSEDRIRTVGHQHDTVRKVDCLI